MARLANKMLRRQTSAWDCQSSSRHVVVYKCLLHFDTTQRKKGRRRLIRNASATRSSWILQKREILALLKTGTWSRHCCFSQFVAQLRLLLVVVKQTNRARVGILFTAQEKGTSTAGYDISLFTTSCCCYFRDIDSCYRPSMSIVRHEPNYLTSWVDSQLKWSPNTNELVTHSEWDLTSWWVPSTTDNV